MPPSSAQSGQPAATSRAPNQLAQQPYYAQQPHFQQQQQQQQQQHLQRQQQHYRQQQQQQQPSPPPSSSSQSSQQQQQQDRAPSQPIGRSQSAFNFLLNKAKAPFSSSSSSSTLNASTSLTSLSVHQEDPFDDTTNHIQYHRQLQNDHAFPHAPASANHARRQASGNVDKPGRSHPLADAGIGSHPPRPSFTEETPNAVASPTKRGFFGGIGRDRKASTASIKQPAPPKPNFSYSPLSKGQRTDPSSMGSNYAHFSKSQSDLHARGSGADYPSPTNMTVELPRVPAIYQNSAQPPIDRNRYLRSPSPALNFSRSVDDLSIGESPISPFPTTAAPDDSSSSLATIASSTSPGTWGEHGIPVPQPDWRPSDMGTLASPTQQSAASFQRFKAGHNKLDSVASQLQPSSGSVHSPPHSWTGMSPPQHSYMQAPAPQATSRADAKHARKASKLMGKDSSARGAVATSLAASLGLSHLGAATGAVPPLSILTSAEPVPLPPGAVVQGFLARNANISLNLAQLSSHDHGKGKEKDVTKGWKPYRVVLQDGRLYFYKPPSNISDEVKALFPTGIVRGLPVTPISSTSLASLNADALVRSGLSKHDLLSATSSTAEMTSPLPSPSLRPRVPAARPTKTAATPAEVPTTPATATQSSAVDAPRHQTWLKPGKHPDLVLVDTVDAPPAWADRIQSGTPEALAHEFVHATQLPAEELAAPSSRRSIPQSPLAANSGAAAFAAESNVECFVLAVLANTSSSQDAPQHASTQICDFFLEVIKRTEAVVSAGTDITQAEPASLPSLASRLRTLLDVAIRAGLARILHVDTVRKLAELASMDADELDTKLQTYAKPILPLSDDLAADPPSDWVSKLADEQAAGKARQDLRELRKSLVLSDDLLLQLEPLEIAQQIQIFHADALRRLVTCGASFVDLVHPTTTDANAIAALSFDSLSPHPLTTLALNHLLDSSSSAKDTPSLAQNGARHRASVLRHWIAIASYLFTLGDVAGWMAVCAALCSRAVTRLEQTWRYLAEGDRVLVAEEWAPILSSLSWTEGLAVQARARFVGDGIQSFATLPDGARIAVVPYLGSAFYRTLRQPQTLSTSPSGVPTMFISSRAEDAGHLWSSVNEWRTVWQQASAEPRFTITRQAEPLAEYQAALQRLFQNAKLQSPTMQSDMERSFRLEPKALGNLDARERPSLPSSADADLPLVPLLFPQPLPLLSLLNASQIRASLVRRSDQRAHQTNDPQATITSRSTMRPSLAGSPLVRSSAFSPTLGNRSVRNAAFSGVAEWSSSSAALKWDDANNGIIKVGNELVLRIVLQDTNLSLPGSPMTSKRFSQDFGRASRPLSQVSKRSSLPASNRSSVIDIVVPVQVVVKAATLDRMIDLLVMGVQHINVSPAPSPVDGAEPQSAPQRKTRLVMDMEAYRTTFLATFRSLCSAPELFEQLQKRFSAAIMASKELAGADEFRSSSQFPSWLGVTPAGSQAEPTDWEMVYRIRMGVVLTLRLWIDRFPQDFVDDDDLYHLALGFLRHSGIEVTPEDPDQQKVNHALAQLRSMFGARIMGANARQEERSYATSMAVQISDCRQQAEFDFDRASAAELVEYLESIATVFFDKIVDRDLLVVSEIFEKQTINATAWFTVKTAGATTGEEDKPITNMYTLLDCLRASDSANADGGKDTERMVSLQNKLPSTIRDALAAQSLFRGWIAIHIIESGIGLERRQERLSKLLDALWLCRARMLKLRGDEATNAHAGSAAPAADALPFSEPTIGSFVESAIVNTLGSSESRIFLRAWQGVAAARGGRGDGIDDLMPKQIDADLRSAAEMAGTPDIGWILACLAEAATRAPSVQTSTSDVELVDFEKRRTTWALIDGAVRVRPACSIPDLVDLAGARLRLMQSALERVIWDRRAFREDAAKEMRNAPPVRSDAQLRPTSSSKALSGLSKQQQEKLRRDRAALEMLNSLPLAPPISSRVSSMPSSRTRAPNASSLSFPLTTQSSEKAAMAQAPPPDKATIRARRMTALFKGAVRPLISLDKANEPSKPTAELMRLTPLQKPSLVAGLAGARVSVWNNAQRSFVFHLTSQEGAKYLLQTTNAAELAEWISQIERASKEYAAPKPADVRKGSVPSKGKAAPAPLYGRPLVELVEREGHSVPTAIERMFAEVEARGLREQGIYRISGSKSAVENLRRAWDQQPAESIDISTGEYSDVHTIAGAIKTWLRELPEPLITFDSYDAMIATNAMENDDRLYAMRDIIWKMPKCHFDVLRRTAEHLARVVEEGEINKMLAHNVALVFGTSLLNPPPGPSSVAIGFGNLGKAANVVKTIVTMHEWLFEPEPEPEPEPEVEPEPETEIVAVEGQLGGFEQSVDTEHEADPVSEGVDELASPVDSMDATRPRGASMSSSHGSAPQSSQDVAAPLGQPDEAHAQVQAQAEAEEEEEASDLAELAPRPRRGGRTRPLTIVGLDGLTALGGNEAIAKVLESGASPSAETPDGDDAAEEAQVAQVARAAPRIVLSGDGESDEEVEEDDASDSEGERVKEQEQDKDKEEGEGKVAVERQRKTRSTYRDSVFTSYSIYADCFDSMKLESQSSAASMVKRQSMHLVQSSAAPETDAK